MAPVPGTVPNKSLNTTGIILVSVSQIRILPIDPKTELEINAESGTVPNDLDSDSTGKSFAIHVLFKIKLQITFFA